MQETPAPLPYFTAGLLPTQSLGSTLQNHRCAALATRPQRLAASSTPTEKHTDADADSPRSSET